MFAVYKTFCFPQKYSFPILAHGDLDLLFSEVKSLRGLGIRASSEPSFLGRAKAPHDVSLACLYGLAKPCLGQERGYYLLFPPSFFSDFCSVCRIDKKAVFYFPFMCSFFSFLIIKKVVFFLL